MRHFGHLSGMACVRAICLATLLITSACSSGDVEGDPSDGEGPTGTEPVGSGSGGSGSGGRSQAGTGAGGPVVDGAGGDGSSPAMDSPWLGAKRAAVTLTYDDGLDGQLQYAVPALDARGLRATFFLSSFQGVDHAWSLPNLSDALTPRHDAWAVVAAAGHELGGHTIYHPCDNNNPGFQPEDYSEARMAAELDEAKGRLARLGAAAPFSFAYPCAGDTVGIAEGGSYTSLVDQHYAVARASSVGVSMADTVELSAVPQKFGDAEGMSSAQLIAFVDEAIAVGGWAVFTFHGVGPAAECDINNFDLDACALNYLTTEATEHEALLDYLVERRDEVWTAPMKEVAAHIQSLR